MNNLRPPFANGEEYRKHAEKEAAIYVWVEHILETIDPRWQEGNEVDEVWEGEHGYLGKLIINYTHGREDAQTWIPLTCLWSEDWENMNKEAKEKANRQWKEQEKKRLSEKAAIKEADERALLAHLQEKYPDAEGE